MRSVSNLDSRPSKKAFLKNFNLLNEKEKIVSFESILNNNEIKNFIVTTNIDYVFW